MFFIEENDKPMALEKLFNIIKIKDNRIIVPMQIDKNKNKLDKDKLEKSSISKIDKNDNIKKAKKTKKFLDKTKTKKIVLSKKIKENEIYVNMLYSYGYEIVDGRWLFEALSYKVLDYIVNSKDLKKEEIEVSILVNNLTEYTLANIKKIAQEYKLLNIVTNHMEKFKKIEEKIYNENGLMITVTNNKKKSLKKSQIILNIDFPKELLNEYFIYEDAIIVNICGNMKITKKRFNRNSNK